MKHRGCLLAGLFFLVSCAGRVEETCKVLDAGPSADGARVQPSMPTPPKGSTRNGCVVSPHEGCGLLDLFRTGSWACSLRTSDAEGVQDSTVLVQMLEGHGACLGSASGGSVWHREFESGDCTCDGATGVLRCAYATPAPDSSRQDVAMACVYGE